MRLLGFVVIVYGLGLIGPCLLIKFQMAKKNVHKCIGLIKSEEMKIVNVF